MSGVEALNLFRTQPEKFDLVITGLTMPHMTGLDLAGQIPHLRPDLPILLCTGFNEMVTPEKVKAAGIREFLMKPLNLEVLAETIRRMIEGKPGEC